MEQLKAKRFAATIVPVLPCKPSAAEVATQADMTEANFP
jgi:hypothetical protein